MGVAKINLLELENNKTKKFVQKLDQTEKGTLIFELTPKYFDQIKKPNDLFKEDSEDTEKTEAVFEKLRKSDYKLDNDSLIEMAENLSNIDKLKTTYLPTNWVDALRVHEEITSPKELVSKSIEELSYDEFEELKDYESMKKELETESNPRLSNLQKDLKIKIVFVDQMRDSSFQQGVRKILSPILSDFNVSSMGFFHTALLIGPWFIEWNDSSLCIPRNCTSRSAFLSADIGEIGSVESLESIRDKVAKVICDWNVSVNYSTLGHKKNEGNCQNFVETILSALDLKFQTSGVLEKFLTSIKKNGNAKLAFPVSKEMQEEFGIDKDSIEFKTHTQLDQFCHDLFDKNLTFEMKYKDEYILLKSFDRAFWLRNLKTKKELVKHRNAIKMFTSKNMPEEKKQKMIQCAKDKIELLTSDQSYKDSKPFANLDESEECEMDNCPFGDPSETKSFWV